MKLARKVFTLALTLGVTTSMLFGVTTALAVSGPAVECQDDGYNFFGECLTETWCDSQCRFVGGDVGYCDDSNCCLCVH